VRSDDVTIAVLVVLPLVAAISLGFLMRTLVGSDRGSRSWPVWLVVLVVACVVWWLYFSEIR
jgi:hypothetical protein